MALGLDAALGRVEGSVETENLYAKSRVEFVMNKIGDRTDRKEE
jgi:hypothetical protein